MVCFHVLVAIQPGLHVTCYWLNPDASVVLLSLCFPMDAQRDGLFPSAQNDLFVPLSVSYTRTWSSLFLFQNKSHYGFPISLATSLRFHVCPHASRPASIASPPGSKPAALARHATQGSASHALFQAASKAEPSHLICCSLVLVADF